jgi:hypothetical protein
MQTSVLSTPQMLSNN